MDKLLNWFERYGLLIVLLNCFALLPPDLSIKQSMIELDVDIANKTRSGGSLIKQLSWILSLLIYLLCFFRKEMQTLIRRELLTLALVFILISVVCVFSTVWSDFKPITIKRSLFQIILMLVLGFSIFYAIKHNSFVDCVNLLFYISVSVCVISLILGSGYQGANLLGWANTKNSFGAYMLAMMMLIYLARNFYQEEFSLYAIKMLVLFLLLSLTVSKTSIFLAILMILMTYLSKAISRNIMLSVLTVLGFFFLCMPIVSVVFGDYWDVSYMMEPDTLTGRGTIWDVLYYDLYNDHQLFLGHGYGAYFNTGVIPSILDDTWSFIRLVNSAHNGYLELLLQFGVFFSLLLLVLICRLILLTDNSFCFSVASIIFLYNITESSLLRDQSVTWVIMIVLICLGCFTKNNTIEENNEEDVFLSEIKK